MTSPRLIGEIELTVPWGRIAGKTWGTRDGNRVLVVHGTLDNAGSFDRIMPLLPNNFYYVVIDLPGHGLSSPLPLGVQLDFLNYVLAIRLVLDELKWENCVYMGHSFGAQLGLFTSILCPGRISRIACLDGFLPRPLEDDELLEMMRALQETALMANKSVSPPLKTRDEILYALKNKRNFSLNSQAAEALFVRATTKIGHLYKYNRDFRLRLFVNPLFDFSQYVGLLKHLKIPVLIILAEWSWTDGAYSQRSIEAIKKVMGDNYKIVRVSGNHDVHNNDPEVVAPHLCEFLNGTTKSKL